VEDLSIAEIGIVMGKSQVAGAGDALPARGVLAGPWVNRRPERNAKAEAPAPVIKTGRGGPWREVFDDVFKRRGHVTR